MCTPELATRIAFAEPTHSEDLRNEKEPMEAKGGFSSHGTEILIEVNWHNTPITLIYHVPDRTRGYYSADQASGNAALGGGSQILITCYNLSDLLVETDWLDH